MGTLLAALLLAAAPAAALDFPERRRDQFRGDFGYAVVPFVYDLPGIGKGYGFLGGFANVAGTYTDVEGSAFFGDVNGQALAVNSIHLLNRRLILDAGGTHLGKVSLNGYSQRGIGSDPDDYTILEFEDGVFGGSRLTATFDERRWEPYLAHYSGSFELKHLRDRDGNIILEADGSRQAGGATAAGMRVDLTDDALDPHRGLRVEPSVWYSPPQGNSADYYKADLAVTGYVPAGQRNTWAFQYFRSDAVVLDQGLTDRAALEKELGADCSAAVDAQAQADCRDVVDTYVTANRNGSATSLGGISRLRSYGEGRFQGAHTEFLATEFRLNVSNQVRPFDVYLLRDIRTALQFAFFYELGTVAETRGGLWKKSRSTYGGGFRLVTGSGVVYRIDIAAGQEGTRPSIFFQYPWELF